MALKHVRQRPQRAGSVGNLFEHLMEFLGQRLRVFRQPLNLGQARASLLYGERQGLECWLELLRRRGECLAGPGEVAQQLQ